MIKHRLFSLLTAMLLLSAGNKAEAESAIYSQNDTGITLSAGAHEIKIDFYSPTSVRVQKFSAGHNVDKTSCSVIAVPGKSGFSARQSGNNIILKTEKLTMKIDTGTGTIGYFTHTGAPLLKEQGAAVFKETDDAGTPSYEVTQAFGLEKNEPIYGLGNLENGQLSQRGISRTLMPGNVEDGISVIQSVKGYGIIWDNYSPTTVTDKDNTLSFRSDVGECVDYYFMYGGNADGVVAEIRFLTGDVPMFPLWTYGFWQSRERYKTQAEIVEVVDRHRKLGVPLDGIIQDWQYWGNNYLWNAMEFMNADFNHPQRMIDQIHAQNAHIIISIWSSFGPQTKPYRELDEKGLLFNFSTWPQSGIAEQWPPRMDYPSGVRVYDAYSPEARDIYWKHLSRLHAMKLDGWWMDSTEPDHLDFKPEDLNTPTHMGSFRKVRNAYPLLTVGGVYDHQRAVDSTKRVFILTRSGFTGQQRYGCNVWTGDVSSTWQTLRNQLPAGLNFTLTGNPNFNSDIGGFFCGGYNTHYNDNTAVKNPLFQELYVRWMQFGVFCPMMRSHGTDIRREIYEFGQPGEVIYDAILGAIKLRYTLLPYIYSTSWKVTRDRSSFMRALMMDFPHDKKGWEINDQFMFGNNLLVAPVVKAQYTPEKVMKIDENSGWNKNENSDTQMASGVIDFLEARSTQIYLPSRTTWYDFWTNEKHNGGTTITRKTDISTIPLYVRAGSILPIGPDVQYATEKSWNELEIRIYPGADGEFTLYEDEFDNYNYEKGLYSTIRFAWDNKKQTLTIGERSGSFPGMIGNRKFRIVKINTAPTAPTATETIEYDGKAQSIRL